MSIEHVHCLILFNSLMIFMDSGPTAYHICNKSILCMIIIAFYGYCVLLVCMDYNNSEC